MAVLDRNIRDVIGGAGIAAVGCAFFFRSFAYGIGGLSEMGAGFFPMALSAVAIVLGLAIAVTGFAGKAVESEEKLQFRPLVAVLGGVAAFAALLIPFGLGPAVAAAAIIAGMGDPQNRLPGLLALAAVLSIGCWLIFSVGLKLPLPLIRGVF